MAAFPNVLVTGGSGFIGTNLVDFFSHTNCNLLNIDVKPPRNNLHCKFWQNINILDYDQMRKTIYEFQPHYIFHLAARTDLDGQYESDYASNVQGVTNILNCIQELTSLKRILFASSRLVCKIGYLPSSFDDYCPPNLYGQSKVLGECIIKNYSHHERYDWLIFRPTSIWGEWFDIPYKNFFESVISGRYVHPAGQSIYKSFGYVKNSVYQLDCLSHAPRNLVHGRTFYLADYPPIEVNDMANRIRSYLGLHNVHQVPLFLLTLMAKSGDIMKTIGFKNPPLTSFRLNNLLTQMVYHLDSLKFIVGDLPFSLEEGIANTLDWMDTDNK